MLKFLMIFLSTTITSSIKLIQPINLLSYKNIRPLYNDLYNINKDHKMYSLEHIIPQSIFKRDNTTIRKDMHNIILYPNKLNVHRSNFKFTANSNIYPTSKIISEDGIPLIYNEKIEFDYGVKTSKFKTFYPHDKYKGYIARSSMYFLMTYPEYREKIFSEIIDPYTILNWHHQYPVCQFENDKNEAIKEVQKNSNIYVSYPKELVEHMEILVNEDLKIFKNYKYKKID